MRTPTPLLSRGVIYQGRFPVATAKSRALAVRRRRYSTNTPPKATPFTAPPSPPSMSESELVRRLMRSQRVWWWIGSTVLAGVGLVAFGPELKLGMSKHTADVASRSLQDETLRDNTRELASQIVQTVLNDPKVLDQASLFLQRVRRLYSWHYCGFGRMGMIAKCIAQTEYVNVAIIIVRFFLTYGLHSWILQLVVMDSTREALRALVIHTLNDPQTRSQVTELTQRTVAALLEDPKTLRQVVDLLRSMVVDPRAKEALLLLLEQLMRDEKTRANLTQLLAHTFLQEPVKQNVGRSLTEAVHDVLSRRDVQNHAKEFVSGVVRDQTVQAQGGDAIWSTVMYAVTPGWLSWMWEQSEEDGDVLNPAQQAAEAVVAAAVEEKDTSLSQENARTSTVEAKEGSKQQEKLKKPSKATESTDLVASKQKQAAPATPSTSTTSNETAMMTRTRTKRLSPARETSVKNEKSAEPTKTKTRSRAEFSDLYEDRNWNGSGSGFL
ncbi:hypothetical protein BBJ28_00014592 [Nothophytophthora sp. Chile5]|nr:hypothetical protein BBJ28_00014592 [Nothophytophthora sp. Chile5]